MGQTRDEKAFARAGELMARIATVRPQARFFMQAGDAALAQRVAAAARAGGASAEIVIGGLAHEAYWRRLLANDLMLLPYDGHAYALMPSGPFCEAAAAGVPVVAPRHTWMGDRLAEGSAAGVTFDAATPDQIVAATARALDALPALKAQAAILAPAWRAERSLDNHIEAILELLGLRPPS
jgi:glycosyltransferase involved in cell wall biosynthesis